MACHKRIITRSLNGLDIATWVFCHNLVKIRLVVIEILSFSCSVLFLVKADEIIW